MKPVLVMLCVLLTTTAYSKEVFYELNVDHKTVNFSGQTATAMAINGSIPAPKLEFTEGDVAIIKVINHTQDEASIHWHGLLLPQEQDGVPYITYFPIAAGASFKYRFELKHAGTYWYHSHTRIDEQKGQYGSIVVHPKQGYQQSFDHDVVVQLSDWTDEDPVDVLKNLKMDGDWYAYKKDSVFSIQGYLENSNLDAWLTNRWQRMEGMDVSDVGYDAFLANGQTSLALLPDAKAGEKVRVRLINSGASSYFDIQQRSGVFEVVAADGLDVQPIKVKELRMGMAETYDVIVTIPSSGGFEFAANNIDGTGGVKVKLGSGSATPSPDPQRPNVFAKMQHGDGDGEDHSMHQMSNTTAAKQQPKPQQHNHHQHHQMMKDSTEQIVNTLNYALLKTRQPVKYTGELQTYTLRLTGDMESYNWNFNNLPLSKADVIKIDKGKVVRFHFKNESMMHHPLHLHGHFFKVISGNGEYDVLKHTVDVPPMGSVTIEFAANEEKDWFFHCHNLYHAKTGMARVVRYSDYQGNPAFTKAKMLSNEIMDDDWYSRSDLTLLSSHLYAKFRISNTNYMVELAAEKHFSEALELGARFHYKQSSWLQYFLGVEREAQENELMVGLKYITPFNIETAIWINDEGKIQAEAETEFQLTPNIGLSIGASSESEWQTALEYRSSPNWSIAINANETSGVGVGITATF
ncbi:multicopper oxidase domain-containing protein [uncultured Paraglaciecola sp.]|uniref:multicopper oxidase domain-containing protein n=1 Tax=uncultured Paraglaciecola sp. TaxID=1765024 RepID=UPI002612D5EB|nr:multicopper oxidase domain-containing protein [uncultured Paraglaciecola sp.]